MTTVLIIMIVLLLLLPGSVTSAVPTKRPYSSGSAEAIRYSCPDMRRGIPAARSSDPVVMICAA